MSSKFGLPQRVLFVSPVTFLGLKQRHQAIAEGLAHEGIHVYFLEPILAPGFSCRIFEVNQRLHVIRLHVFWRAASYPALQAITVKLAASLLRSKGLLGFRKTALWVADPTLSALIHHKWEMSIYDRCDRHGSFYGQSQKAFVNFENTLFEKARVTFASSPLLLKEARSRGAQNAYLIANAAPKDWLETPRIQEFPMFPPVRAISSGAHYEWIDFDWLARLAENSRIELHLAGTGRGNQFKTLSRHPRVFFHGKVPHNRLLHLIDSCHVGLIPFVRSPLTEAVDPIKLYEYASRGVLVWATDIEHFRSNSLVTNIFSKRDNLSAEIDRICCQLAKSVKVKPCVPSWDDRVRAILQELRK